jgi:hypothetical protein
LELAAVGGFIFIQIKMSAAKRRFLNYRKKEKMEIQPPKPPEEDETQRAIREAQERVGSLYDRLASRRNTVSPARLAINRYLEMAAQREQSDNPSIDKSPDVVDVPLPEGEDKV